MRSWADFDDLVGLTVQALTDAPGLADAFRAYQEGLRCEGFATALALTDGRVPAGHH